MMGSDYLKLEEREREGHKKPNDQKTKFLQIPNNPSRKSPRRRERNK